jgi:hypothetical protein
LTDTVGREENMTDLADPADLRDQRNRVWAHALHVDNAVIQRNNLYLVAQSMLVGAYAVFALANPQADQSQNPARASIWILLGGGAAVALLWLVSNHLYWRYLLCLRQRCLDLLPEYRVTWQMRPRGQSGHIISYVIPLIFLAIWVVAALQSAGVLSLPTG